MPPSRQAASRSFFDRVTIRHQIVILVVIAAGLYFNSIFGEYAVDDNMVITANQFTQKGVAGIPEILLNDSFKGAFGGNQLTGGRYRPLSIVTFALEWQLFGRNPMVSHIGNVLLFCGIVVLLFAFLQRFIFKESSIPAFLAALIFAIHPIHTEAVANIKSRDELMSLFFLLIALYAAAKAFIEERRGVYLVLGVSCFLLALLSKENAITFIAVLPLVLYFFSERKPGAILTAMLPFGAVGAAYLLLRYFVAGFPARVTTADIYLDPYALATASQAFATKVYVLVRYLALLVYPRPLCWDHTYNDIPYVSVADAKFVVSLVIHLGLLVYAGIAARRKTIAAFCILLYFVLLSVVSNFVLETGTPLAERFLFQPSMAFAIACAYGIGYLLLKASEGVRQSVAVALVAVVVVGGYMTIDRNSAWANDSTLFYRDADSCPGSSRINMSAGVILTGRGDQATDPVQKKQHYEEAVRYLEKARSIHPKALETHINLATVYSRMGDVDNTAKALDGAMEVAPESALVKGNARVLSQMLVTRASDLYTKEHRVPDAIAYYEKALRYDPLNVRAMYEIGGMYLMSGDVSRARETWQKTLTLKPDHADAKDWLQRTAGR